MTLLQQILNTSPLELMTKNNSDCRTEYCYHVNQFIFAAAKTYCNFHILFMYCSLYFPLRTFTLHFLCFFFFFIDRHSKAVAVNQTIYLCFCKRSTICKLNVQAATAVDEEQYTLSNIIYITF